MDKLLIFRKVCHGWHDSQQTLNLFFTMLPGIRMAGFLFQCLNSFQKQLVFVFTMNRWVLQLAGQFKSSFSPATLLLVNMKYIEYNSAYPGEFKHIWTKIAHFITISLYRWGHKTRVSLDISVIIPSVSEQFCTVGRNQDCVWKEKWTRKKTKVQEFCKVHQN